jgi:hypothetical protein
MIPMRAPLVVVACLIGAVGLRAEEEPKLDAAGLLARIDGALCLPDAQTGLEGYSCRASVTTSSTSRGSGPMTPDASKAELLAKVEVDVARATRTWKDKDGKAIPVGAWTPSCGPWTLTNVMQVETELFLSPLSPRFPETTWKREVEPTDSGWRLVLTPRSSSVNAAATDFLTPALTRLELLVDRDGTPSRGTLGLDLGPMKDEGAIAFEFEDVSGKKRIKAIRSTLTSANLTIHPVIRFDFAAQKGFPLLERVVFEVPSGDLSPTLGATLGGSIASALLLTEYKVKGRAAASARSHR